MKRPGPILLGRLAIVYQVSCFLLAVYMSVILVARFIANQSATLISYQHYHNSPDDIYPTFSICFTGTSFHWYGEMAIFRTYGLTSYEYERMLKGESAFRYEYDDLN